ARRRPPLSGRAGSRDAGAGDRRPLRGRRAARERGSVRGQAARARAGRLRRRPPTDGGAGADVGAHAHVSRPLRNRSMRVAWVARALACATRAGAFGLDDVAHEAQQIAREPYRDRQTHVPAWMLEGSMTYDQWRDIRFKPAQSLWRSDRLPFEVQL